ncbi:MAG: hypothetical protein AB7P52_09595 [Alphaproteobacteria bacterium]
MADRPIVHLGKNSPEQVAWRLMQTIMQAEAKTANPLIAKDGGEELVDRRYLIGLYRDCLQTVRNA